MPGTIDISLSYYFEDTFCGGATVKKYTQNNVLGIWDVEIFQPFRGIGLGAIMMNEVMEYILDNFPMRDGIFLKVTPDNKIAQYIYLNLGFEFSDRKDCNGNLYMTFID
jgi:ribosomal protein S18 acetylase RimI-like enzyme